MTVSANKPQLMPLERLMFPLDAPDSPAALQLASQLKEHVGWFKVGLELFISEGSAIIDNLKNLAPGTKIFLDLKLHDIPATVGRAMKIISRLGVNLVTVHAQGGSEMMSAAVANAGETKVAAVTVLTSLNPARLTELTAENQKPGAYVCHLAEKALNAGCQALVASGHETAVLRKTFGHAPWLVIPGIRPAWAEIPGDDQQRTATPRQAVENGADFLVIGRPIRDAENPAAAADKIVAELSGL